MSPIEEADGMAGAPGARVVRDIRVAHSLAGLSNGRASVAALERGVKMADFDYNAEAELFPSRARSSRRQPVGYKRFAHAADAIRFAIEDLPPDALVGAWLEVDEERFDGSEIRRLYDSANYPLRRSQSAASTPVPQSGPASAKSSRAR
jgi:hypothetical protein